MSEDISNSALPKKSKGYYRYSFNTVPIVQSGDGSSREETSESSERSSLKESVVPDRVFKKRHHGSPAAEHKEVKFKSYRVPRKFSKQMYEDVTKKGSYSLVEKKLNYGQGSPLILNGEKGKEKYQFYWIVDPVSKAFSESRLQLIQPKVGKNKAKRGQIKSRDKIKEGLPESFKRKPKRATSKARRKRSHDYIKSPLEGFVKFTPQKVFKTSKTPAANFDISLLKLGIRPSEKDRMLFERSLGDFRLKLKEMVASYKKSQEDYSNQPLKEEKRIMHKKMSLESRDQDPFRKYSQSFLPKSTPSLQNKPVSKASKHRPSRAEKGEYKHSKSSVGIDYRPERQVKSKDLKVGKSKPLEEHPRQLEVADVWPTSPKSHFTHGTLKRGQRLKIPPVQGDKIKRPSIKMYEINAVPKFLEEPNLQRVLLQPEAFKKRVQYSKPLKEPYVSRPGQSSIGNAKKTMFVQEVKPNLESKTVGATRKKTTSEPSLSTFSYSKERDKGYWGFPVTIIKEKRLHQKQKQSSSRMAQSRSSQTPKVVQTQTEAGVSYQGENICCSPEYTFFPFPDSRRFPCPHDDDKRCTICSARKNPIIDPNYPGRNPAYGRDMLYPIPRIPDLNPPPPGIRKGPLCLVLDRRLCLPEEEQYEAYTEETYSKSNTNN